MPRVDSSLPFCVKFFFFLPFFSGAVCSLVISLSPLAEWEGRRESASDERGISLTKSVSTTKRRLYQIPLIPTQRCHTNHSPALSCCAQGRGCGCGVEEGEWPHLLKANIIFFFSQAGLIETPLILPPPPSLPPFEIFESFRDTNVYTQNWI